VRADRGPGGRKGRRLGSAPFPRKGNFTAENREI